MSQYFVFLNKKKQGPYTISELENMDISSNTLIWTKGMDDWTKASEYDELSELLQSLPPPIPQKEYSFLTYLKKNFKYVILSGVVCFILLLLIMEHFYDYLVENVYGGYQSENFQTNHSRISDEIFAYEEMLVTFIIIVGIVIVPIFYFIKKKK